MPRGGEDAAGVVAACMPVLVQVDRENRCAGRIAAFAEHWHARYEVITLGGLGDSIIGLAEPVPPLDRCPDGLKGHEIPCEVPRDPAFLTERLEQRLVEHERAFSDERNHLFEPLLPLTSESGEPDNSSPADVHLVLAEP